MALQPKTITELPLVMDVLDDHEVVVQTEDGTHKATVGAVLAPVVERLDALEGDVSEEGIIQKNKLFSYTARVVGTVGAIELDSTMQSLGLSSAGTLTFSTQTGNFNIPVQPVDTIQVVFNNAHAALTAANNPRVKFSLYAGSVMVEALPANGYVSFTSGVVIGLLGLNSKSARAKTKTERLSVSGELVGSGNGYSSVANDISELVQKQAAQERAIQRAVSIENAVRDVETEQALQAIKLGSLDVEVANLSSDLSTVETAIGTLQSDNQNINDRLDFLEGQIIETGTPRRASSNILVTSGLASNAPVVEIEE